MDIKIDSDLVDTVSRGELDEWQAMAVQTCRDAAYARSEVEDVKKKLAALVLRQEADKQPDRQTSLIKLVARSG